MARFFMRLHTNFNLALSVVGRTRSVSQLKNTMPGSTTASPAKNVVPEAKANLSSPPRKRLRVEDKNKSRPTLRFCKMTDNASTPTRGSEFAAGYDLYSAYDYKITAKGKALIKTDIQIELPSGCYGRVAPRSGLAHKHFLDVGAGVIDEDYRGNVGVILFNFSEVDYEVKKGDRVAQLICERIYYPDLLEVDSLTETERGAGGYGSTGKH